MKNLTKNSVANVAKVGVASALIGAGLFLSACGGDSTSKAEKFVKEQYPDAKILSFSEIQKEFGIKNKECLAKNSGVFTRTHHFLKTPSGELVILSVMTDNKNGASRIGDTYSSVDNFKNWNSSCFE